MLPILLIGGGTVAGLLFASLDRETERQLAIGPSAERRKLLALAAKPPKEPYRWLLSLVMEDDIEHCLYEYFEAESHWGIIPRPLAYGYGTMQQEDCPTGDCQVEQEVDDESGKRLGPLSLLACDLCRLVDRHSLLRSSIAIVANTIA